jgi:phage FluMu gp28-like protein
MDSLAEAVENDPTILPLYEYQRDWVLDESRFKMGLWSRQTGKSFSTALEAVLDGHDKKCDWVFLSSGERQSKELIRKAKMHGEAFSLACSSGEEDVRGKDGTVYKQLEVEWKNGSRILALPANPDTARGHSANVVLDEFAFHKDSKKIWASLFPTITRGYKIRVISTPQGKKNKFYELWSGNQRYSKHFVDIYRAYNEGLPIYGDTGPATPEYLREALDDDEAWQQEYLCQFIDESSAFIPYEMINQAELEQLDYEDNPLMEGARIYAGIDVGRVKDMTVYYEIQVVGDVMWTKRVLELRGEKFADQKTKLAYEIHSKKPFRVCIDGTGLGMQLAEELQTMFGSRIEIITFRNSVKEELAIRTKRAFEDRLIRIPVNRHLREDIHNVKKVVTAAGNTRFDADRTKDGHSDRFFALALAIHAAANCNSGDNLILVGSMREATGMLNQFGFSKIHDIKGLNDVWGM